MAKHIYRRVHALILVCALSACGGGGGGTPGSGSSVSIPPITTPSALSSANRALFNDGVVLGRLLASTLAANRSAFITGSGSSITATIASPCTGGGTGMSGGAASLTLTRDPSDTVNGTAVYAGFNGCFDVGVSGTASVSGVLSSSDATFSSLTLSFNNLLISRSPLAYRFTGTVSIVWNATGYVTTVNGSAKNDLTGIKLFNFDKYGIDALPALNGIAGAQNLLVSGQLTNALLGATVDLASPSRIYALTGSSGFFSGLYLMQIAGFSGSALYTNGFVSFP